MSGFSSFEPIRRIRAHESIVKQVVERVRSGELSSGDRLPSERVLIQQFGVSRSTVREALRVLESLGVINIRPGDRRGARIEDLSMGPLARSLESLVQVEHLSLYDLVFFRMMVEGVQSAVAAKFHSARHLQELRLAMDNVSNARDASAALFSATDVAFHDTIATIGGNRLTIVCSEVVRKSVMDLISEKIASGVDREKNIDYVIARHQELYDAILSGSSEEAMRVSRTNLFEHYARYLDSESKAKLQVLLDE